MTSNSFRVKYVSSRDLKIIPRVVLSVILAEQGDIGMASLLNNLGVFPQYPKNDDTKS